MPSNRYCPAAARWGSVGASEADVRAGVISRHEYEDAELLMAMREELNHDGSEYRFVDDEILGPFGELHCVAALPPVPTFLQPGEADEALIAMQRQRYQQMVRSTMVLSITDLIAGIGAKQPSRLSPSAAAKQRPRATRRTATTARWRPSARTSRR